MKIITCPQCECSFTRATNGQKFCSKACQSAHWSARSVLKSTEVTHKKCGRCGQTKEIGAFGRHAKIGYQAYCTECMHSYTKDNQERIRSKTKDYLPVLQERLNKWVFNYLKEHPCVKCGVSNVLCLDFHHIDPSTKLDGVSQLLAQRSFQKMQKEIEKCEILCANCHRIHTHEQLNSFKWRLYLENLE